MVMSLRVAEVSELGKKINSFSDKIEAKNFKLQAMPGLIEEATMFQIEVTKLWEDVTEDGANVADMSCLGKEVSAVVENVAEMLLAVEKSPDLRVGAENKSRLAEMKFSLVKHQEKSLPWRLAIKNCLLQKWSLLTHGGVGREPFRNRMGCRSTLENLGKLCSYGPQMVP